MSEWTEYHQPCEKCESSDAVSINDRGWATCFSCNHSYKVDGSEESVMSETKGTPLIARSALDFEGLRKRGISEETCRKYGYATCTGQYETKVQVAPYYDRETGKKAVAQKIRFPNKEFTIRGDIKQAGLFGQQLCRRGGKMIVITEGEIDALSVAEVMGLNWPAISPPNGATSAKKALAAELEFLESFDKVVLAFDNDEAGHKALDECLPLFSPGKAATVDLGDRKDANEFLQDDARKQLRDAIWAAQPWRPDGIVNMADMKDRVKKPLSMGVQYPWEGLNKLLYGFRPQDLITWTAGTGVGKTAVVSELVTHLIENDVKVGIIYLEEGLDRAGKRIVGVKLNLPIHLPGQEYTDAEFDVAWDATLGSGNLYAYDHFGSLDEDVLLSRMRYMVKALDCKVIVLDHVSMVVSGMDLDKDERRMLDHIVTSMRQLTQETEASFHIISHLKRVDGKKGHEDGVQVSLAHLRGTQAIAQLSDAVIALERNQQAESEEEKNRTAVRVLKNRYAGQTGIATWLQYDPATGRVRETAEPTEETFDDTDY
jgi:twinkle protein